MAMQSGVSTSKVLILVGAGLTSSVILRSGRLSDVISDLQELIKGVNEIEVSPNRFDSAFLAAQGWSFSDVMFVTKKNMANAVASVSKQLEQVSAALASTKRHLTQRLENLDGKLDEQKEISKVIMNEVDDVRSDLSQIGFDIELIQKIVSGLEDKIGVLEDKQDFANAGVWYLCQIAGGIKDGLNTKFFQDYSAKLPLNHPKTTFSEEKSLKGLQFIAETISSGEVQKTKILQDDVHENNPTKTNPAVKTRIHRSYPNGISLRREDIAF
ncbi:uncharacterized protein LOC131219575 isoform X3 [Magnolia sinica]|uniref:uncharacterized protein LOC131219575 isoform X3 n=1 Tax=Magnolia sinica TaxID=86752 RepID=UPI0026590227|nr:uncharacterized protein LOC131219575 isoform X3 [Magnolia sinica]